MATLIAAQTGNFTDATTWKTIATGTGASQTTITSSTNITLGSTQSPAFTLTNGEVIEGVLLHVERSNSQAGSFTVELSDDNGTTWTRTRTIDVTLLPSNPAWVFVKFNTTYTADGGTDYRLRLGVSGTSFPAVRVYRDGTTANWARIFRTSTTATAAATDIFYIADELTGGTGRTAVDITMDSTSSATTYGSINIGGGASLAYGTSASTNYYLKLSGNLNIWGNGTFTMGTSATPVPRSSTAKLEFASTTIAGCGLEVFAGGSFITQGESRSSGKDTYYCLLTATANANATSLSVDTDTGWLDNDVIAIAPTSTTFTQHEKGTLNGNASASTLTVDGFAGTGGGLAFQHLGTTPLQAEVILLTRNVSIFGVSTSSTAFVRVNSAASTVTCAWTQFYFMGSNTQTLDGIYLGNVADFNYCSFHDFTYNTSHTWGGIKYNVNASSFTNNVVYNATWGLRTFTVSSTQTTASGMTITGNVMIRIARTAYEIDTWGATVDNNRIGGMDNASTGFYFDGIVNKTYTGNVAHSCSIGFQIDYAENGVLTDCDIWHTSAWNAEDAGLKLLTAEGNFTTASELTLNNCRLLGATSRNIWLDPWGSLIMNDCLLGGTTTVSAPRGIVFSNVGQVRLNDCTFTTTTGIYTRHTTADLTPNSATTNTLTARALITANNTVFGATTEIETASPITDLSYIASQNHDQTAGSHRVTRRRGVITSDTTIFKTASPSERLAPNNSTFKMSSGPRVFAVASGQSKTVKVWVRESVTGDGTDYNGARARLILRRNDSAGISADTVLDTATASSEGAWEELSGSTGTVSTDSVLEVYVDCSGTTGWLNIDDWSIT